MRKTQTHTPPCKENTDSYQDTNLASFRQTNLLTESKNCQRKVVTVSISRDINMDATTTVISEITWFQNGLAINLEDIADVGRLQPPQRYLVLQKVGKICANFAATRIASEKFEKIWKENRRKVKNEKFLEAFRLVYGGKSKQQDVTEQQECYLTEDSDESQARTTSKHHHEDNAVREGLSKLSPPQLLLVAYYAEMYDFRLLVKMKQFDIFVRLCQDVKVAVEVKGTKKALDLSQTEHLIIHIIEHDLDRAEKFPQFKKQWEQYKSMCLVICYTLSNLH